MKDVMNPGVRQIIILQSLCFTISQLYYNYIILHYYIIIILSHYDYNIITLLLRLYYNYITITS